MLTCIVFYLPTTFDAVTKKSSSESSKAYKNQIFLVLFGKIFNVTLFITTSLFNIQ